MLPLMKEQGQELLMMFTLKQEALNHTFMKGLIIMKIRHTMSPLTYLVDLSMDS